MSHLEETLPLFAEEESYAPEPEVHEGGVGSRLLLPPHRGLTLEQAQGDLREAAAEGTTCQCCGQHTQVYRRRINTGMAYALVLLLKEHEKVRGEAYHLRSLLLRNGYHTGDYCYLVHWKVLARTRAGTSEAYAPGMFRLTKRGAEFARGEVALPEAVFLFGEQVLGFSSTRVTIQEAMRGVGFNYAELMGVRP